MKKSFFSSNISEIELFLEKQKFIKYKNFSIFYKSKFKNLRKDLLGQFSNALNTYNDKVYKASEWKVVIGPWLDKAIGIYLYYTYFFKNKNYDNFLTEKIVKEHCFIPKDYNQFLSLVNDKFFYVYFISLLKKNNIYYKSIKKISLHKVFSLKSIYVYLIKKFIRKKKIYLSNSRLGNLNLLNLFLSSWFKIVPLPKLSDLIYFKTNSNSFQNRSFFINLFNKEDKNLKIIKLLVSIMPSSYLEYFKTLDSFGKNILDRPSKIYSDSSYIDDEVFKIQVAKWKNQGFKNLIIGQHGGNYNLYQIDFLGKHETEISDFFLKWGNEKKLKINNPPSIRLSMFLKKNKKKISKKKFHFCYVLRPLRETNFQSVFTENLIYTQNINNLKNFFKDIKINFIIKYYPEINRYKDQISKNKITKILNIKNHQITSNNSSIFESKILVFDYFSTMLFEMLNLNIPFILIIDKKSHTLSKYGINFLKHLNSMNLLFDNHESASNFLENLNKEPIEWWMEKNRQILLKKLKLKYANTSYNLLYEWKMFLKN